MRRALLEHLPEFIPYFSGAYDDHAGIHYNDHTMEGRLSEHGCQQVLLLGHAAVSLALARLRMHRMCDVHI